MNNKNVIMFGLGGVERYLDENKASQIHIVAVIDNDIKKHGTIKLRNDVVHVIGAEQIPYLKYDEILVVSHSRYSTFEIVSQLYELGVDVNKIKVWTGRNSVENFCYVNKHGNIVYSVRGVLFQIKYKSDIMLLEEIFIKGEYNFYISNENSKIIVFDIGMNTGFASLYFSHIKNVHKVYSYEPFSEPYNSAKENFLLNDCAEKIISKCIGISDANIVCEENFSSDWITASRTDGIVNSSMKNVRLEKVQLADVYEEFYKIMLQEGVDNRYVLKCDCEGSEYKIFSRLADTRILSKFSVIIAETHDGKQDIVLDILKNNSYVCFYESINELQGIVRAVKVNGDDAVEGK